MNPTSSTLPKVKEMAKKWYVIDATDLVLGRAATAIATVLMGKHRPIYTPHLDTGDHIIVINAEKIKVSGKKLENKVYRHHTNWIGGLVERKIQYVMDRTPDEVLHLAVRRMLPKTNLARDMIKKLHIYAGGEHPHQAQKPESFPYQIKKLAKS